jgi:transcription antitermination factor NusG
MGAFWYVLRSKPRKEDFLWGQLAARSIEGYYPRIRVQPVNPRSRKIKPYFPGYLFIHVDLDQINLSTLRWLPGAAGVVSCDGTPAYVPDGLLVAIRRRVDEINAAGGELFDGLEPGDEVVVQGGPFAGYEAIFDARLSGTDRVRVLLKMLSRQQLPAELPSGQVRRKS